MITFIVIGAIFVALIWACDRAQERSRKAFDDLIDVYKEEANRCRENERRTWDRWIEFLRDEESEGDND